MTNFMDPVEVELELETVQPLDDFSAGLVAYPFGRLSPDDFERLLYALYEARMPRDTPYDRVTLMITGADRGRDVWLTKAGRPVGLVQCKRSAGLTAPSVLQEIIKYLLFAKLDPRIAPDVDFIYTLAVADEPTRETIDLFDSQKLWFAANPVRIREALDVVIRDHATFSHLQAADLHEAITVQLTSLSLHILRPTDLNLMIDGTPAVQGRFFKARMVSDNDHIESLLQTYLGDPAGPRAGQAIAAGSGRETFRFLFSEESGFIGSDEELGIIAAEVVISRRANGGVDLVVGVVDDFATGKTLDELNAKCSLSPEERRHRLILRQIVLRQKEAERALTEKLAFLLTSKEIGESWFGAQDFALQGQAIRRLGQYHQMPYPMSVSALRLVLFPSLDRPYPTVHIDLDEAEREAFMVRNEVGELPHGLSAINGYCAMDLLRAVQVGKYAPALTHKLHDMAQEEGSSISDVLATIDAHPYGWALGLA